ncbi:hypothetical protein MNBD_GAMMA09-3049 [hydrothermal vent metagenome]|uniref:Uncharacterized protein n=1 Tax=hydrothermal vent metagenome TaxID=652676 RepID=A0A3B0XFW5_9ZZZZ
MSYNWRRLIGTVPFREDNRPEIIMLENSVESQKPAQILNLSDYIEEGAHHPRPVIHIFSLRYPNHEFQV